MPNDNIDRAIKKGTGAGSEAQDASISRTRDMGLTAFAVLVTVLTDNKNRSAADIRHIFDRAGGKLGTDGSVGWLFERKGVTRIEDATQSEDDVMMAAIDAGAEDVLTEGDTIEIRTDPSMFMAVRQGLEAASIAYTSATLTMIPKDTVPLDENDARKTLRLLDALEDHDDVQEVFANFDIPDHIMEALMG